MTPHEKSLHHRKNTLRYTGGPISEAVENSYVQQRLPVRKQSLAAYPSRRYNISAIPIRSSSIPEYMNRNKTPVPHTTLVNNITDDEDFNFNDRPPSTIVCQSIDLTDQPIIDSFVTQKQVSPTEEWKYHSPTAEDSEIREDSDHRIEEESPYMSLPDLSISDPYSSVFLRIQQKKEEQQRSIDAYRSQHKLYVALLSEIANELHKHIPLTTITKNDIEYHDVFTGKDAIDRLIIILRTSDRKLAVSVGNALKGQNFFHEIKYEKFLIDSMDEIYEFRDMVGLPEERPLDSLIDDLQVIDLPNGVYTPLTDCYSPTCTNDTICYSYSCPRKMSLKRSQSQSSIQEKEENSSLWIKWVSSSIAESISPQERKRQECIYELIYTERNFVEDLRYINKFWVQPLLTNNVIQNNPEEFVKEVFSNIAEVENVNSNLSAALDERQNDDYIVSMIGDIMLQHVCHFMPFVTYGSHQVIGKFTFELEKKRNITFAQFVEATERRPESRRLELNGYLTKPVTRLGRYNLFLNEILKRTADDNPDKEIIPQVIEIITQYLVQVNSEAGKCENQFNLEQIESRLTFKSPLDYVDLQLKVPGRQLLMKGRMKRKGNTSSEASDLQVFLFDHYLVFSKIKYHDHLETYIVHRKPIPLELLTIQVPSPINRQKRTSSILPYSRSTNLGSSASILPKPSTSEAFQPVKPNTLSITFIHHGKKGSPPLTLYTNALPIQQVWIQKITDQQSVLAEKHCVFAVVPLVKRHFPISNRVNNTSVIEDEGNQQILIGTIQGVYITNRDPATKKMTVARIITLEKVSQIELMSDSQLLVLADKTLWTFPLEVLSNINSQVKRGRLVSQNIAYFHVGECLSRTLVCLVKPNTLSDTTIRVFESVIIDENKKSKSLFSFRRLVRGGPIGLKAYKDLYWPSEASSISLLKSKMCISSPREIGIVDMKNLGVQTLLDPEDEELAFVFSKPDVRPVTIYRIQFAEYLVCYNEFAFFVDQRGRFLKSSVRIDWEGVPNSFALLYPYILAFEPEFIEVRNVHTGELEQLIRGKNIRCTSNNTHNTVIQGAMDDPENDGYQLVFQLEKVIKKDPSCE
ncbi:CNH domain-containing protein [Pilobolus umbonatus]|nr:CNH domain-containing protein [Pilobolus umbonatus]